MGQNDPFLGGFWSGRNDPKNDPFWGYLGWFGGFEALKGLGLGFD